jgi:oligopeptide/dipeptide ABC transporter ATP-binding protein
MYAGRIVERAPMRRLFEFPQHAYTRGLLASIPSLTGPVQTELPVIPGMIPALADLSSGCRFAPRSPYAHEQEWLDVRAPLVEIEDNHWVEDCPACRRLNSEALS